MTTTLPPADQVIPLYDKYHIDWAEEEYIDGMFYFRACASGICLIDRLGNREAAEELIDLDDDLDVQERVAKVLAWPDSFLTGVLCGNDGDSFAMMTSQLPYRAWSEENKALCLQGYELGKAVREAFYVPDEEDGDEEGW
jgi:hypothetical protein